MFPTRSFSNALCQEMQKVFLEEFGCFASPPLFLPGVHTYELRGALPSTEVRSLFHGIKGYGSSSSEGTLTVCKSNKTAFPTCSASQSLHLLLISVLRTLHQSRFPCWSIESLLACCRPSWPALGPSNFHQLSFSQCPQISEDVDLLVVVLAPWAITKGVASVHIPVPGFYKDRSRKLESISSFSVQVSGLFLSKFPFFTFSKFHFWTVFSHSFYITRALCTSLHVSSLQNSI